MRTTAIICNCSLLIALAFPVAGCGIFRSGAPVAGNTKPGVDLAMTGHSPVALHNYTIAREYSAAGRYELAREHYLLAYAAAENDGLMQDMLHKELKAVDLMIKTLR